MRRIVPFVVLLIAVSALALLAPACSDGPSPPTPILRPPGPNDLPTEEAFLADLDRSRGHRDIFSVIREPQFVTTAEAPRMLPDELVIGLDLGRVQFAYPVNLLNYHEIVEHTAEGLDLLVCW